MNEVQVDPAEGNLELLETIEGGFLRAPVKAVAPVAHKLPDIIDAAASRPRSPGRLIRPPDTHQPLPQIAQRLYLQRASGKAVGKAGPCIILGNGAADIQLRADP